MQLHQMEDVIQEKERPYYNRSLERALCILNSFEADRPEYTLTQLTAAVNLSRATVLRLCSTLEGFGFLKRDPETKRYSLGIRVFELGSLAFNALSLRRIASGHISRLSKRVGATVLLGVLENDDLIYIAKRDDPTSSVRLPSGIGRRRPPYWGMVGSTILAHRSESDIERILEAHRCGLAAPNSFGGKEEFVARLRRIRRQGYAIDRDASIDGISGVAAPIRDATAKVVAAVGIALISSLVDSIGVGSLIEEAVRTADAISRDLGYMERRESYST